MKASKNRSQHKTFAVMLTESGRVDAIESSSVKRVSAKSKRQAIRKAKVGDYSKPERHAEYAVINDRSATAIKWLSIVVSESKEQALISALKFIKNGNHHV